MKRICTLILISVLLLVGCSSAPSSSDPEAFSLNLSKEELHDILGEPTGSLSGFYGDMYLLDNGTTIIFYYDGNGSTTGISVTDADGNNTLTMGE